MNTELLGAQLAEKVQSWPLRIGIIGCGAVVEHYHLPAAQRVPEVQVIALADTDLDRATDLARRFHVPLYVPNHDSLLDMADAFLLAPPPHLNHSIAVDILRRGKPVLCEKPLALKVKEAKSMIKTARSNGALLAVGHNRRFAWNLEALRRLLAIGGLGRVTEVDVEDGFVFGWSAHTGYRFQRANAGGGVLLDQGVHVIDTLLWLFGDAEVTAYEDDAIGGLESNARLWLRLPEEVSARVWVSRTCEPRNRLLIRATDGWAEAHLYDTNRLTFQARRSKVGQALGPVTIVAEQSQDYVGLMAAQLIDFACSVVGQRAPRASGEDGLRVVHLIQRAYATKQGRPLPAEAPLPGETW